MTGLACEETEVNVMKVRERSHGYQEFLKKRISNDASDVISHSWYRLQQNLLAITS